MKKYIQSLRPLIRRRGLSVSLVDRDVHTPGVKTRLSFFDPTHLLRLVFGMAT